MHVIRQLQALMDAEVIDRQYVRAKLRKDRPYLHSPATDTAPYHPTRIDVGISRASRSANPAGFAQIGAILLLLEIGWPLASL